VRIPSQSYVSPNSTQDAGEAIVLARAALMARLPDAALFLAFALVWAAVFYISVALP
jgi:hypothetical protein